MKLWAVTMGIGAAVGAVAILMMPKTNPTRQVATKAACKVEDTAYRVGDAISQKMGLQ